MNDPDDFRPLPASVLSGMLGADVRWFYREVKELGIVPSPTMYNNKVWSCYPVGTLTLLREIHEQRKAERELPKFMSVGEIADALGKSYGWTTEAIKRHGFRVSKYERRRAFRTQLYAKQVYRILREEVQANPVAETGYNLTQLVELTGFDREWIENRFAEANIWPKLRQSPLTGKVLRFYDEDVADFLRSRPQHPPAGAWLVADTIEKLLGKSTNWTRKRLARADIQALAEIRLDPHLVPRLHYPPEVVKLLKKEIAQNDSYPFAGELLTLSGLAKAAGCSQGWAKKQLQLMKEPGELRRDKKGRVSPHYPQRLAGQLQLRHKQTVRRQV